MFQELSFEDFYEWRVHGWEIPEPYLCVIRVFNKKTGKIKEYSYKQANAANNKIQQLTTDPDNEITIADDEEVTPTPRLSMYEKAEMLEKEIMAHTHRDELMQLITDQINDDFSVRYA